ncbi:hypothetical protein [uncultured Corynebacterium sp.]|uniref:hypothetical protein n=1 Tax=uncultured Corynebacterium sp. TaxID=159447 RepID=UPI0025FE4F40|nr:hypothetical protein [uncultured Corynebacterium sp.]
MSTGARPVFGLVRRFRSYGLSGIAQAMNFVAMLIPVLGRQMDQLTYLVVPLALSGLLCRAVTFAYPGRYLAVPESLVRTASSTAFAGLATGTAVLLVVAAALSGPSDYWAGVVAWGALLTFTHGMYFAAVAVVTRERRIDVYARARVVYGVINVTGTLIVVFLVPFRAGLVVVAGTITIIGATVMLAGTTDRIIPAFVRDVTRLFDSGHRRYLAQSLRATGAQLLTDLAFQIQAFATPFLGAYQEMWAVALRLTGGFSGLAQQVVAPGFEMKISDAVRRGDPGTVRSWTLRGLWSGVVLAFFSAVVVVAAVVFAADGPDVTVRTLLCLGVFTLGSLVTSLVAKVPYITGRDSLCLVWSVIRPTILGVSLLTLSDGPLLTAIAVAQLVSAAAFVPLVLLPPADAVPHTPSPSRERKSTWKARR